MWRIMSGRGFVDYSENGEQITDTQTDRHTGVPIESVPDSNAKEIALYKPSWIILMY